jgi:hypothetical protein
MGSAKIYNYAGSSIGLSGNVYAQGTLTVSGQVNATGSIIPNDDNYAHIGSASFRYVDVWAVDGTINTSDITNKTNINKINKGIDLILSLKPIQFTWKDRTRNHYGFIAQEVKSTMDNLGIDSGAYIDPSVNGEDGYKGLRYTELIAPMVQTIQYLESRIKTLENA